jgi:integrase
MARKIIVTDGATAQDTKLSSVVKEVEALCSTHGKKRVNGRDASIRTQIANREILTESIRRLYQLGRHISTVNQINKTHIDLLVRDWYAKGLAVKTMQNQLSRLRRLTEWIGKPGLIPENAIFQILPEVPTEKLRVRTVAVQSKSWTERGVNVEEKISLAFQVDPRFGCMLLMGLAFGLRRKEQLRIKPWDADGHNRLIIRGSIAKSGRERDIELWHPFQRFALDSVKRVIGKGEHIGWMGKGFKQNQNRYDYLLGKKLLISGKDSDCVGHGLRAEFAENAALFKGLVPAVLGGTKGQLPEDKIHAIQLSIAEDLGHGRVSVTGAYYGTLRN